MVLTRAQLRKTDGAGSTPSAAGVTANVQLGGPAGQVQSKAAKWGSGGGGGADNSEADARRLMWLTIVLFVFGAALLFASVSHAAYRLADGAC